MSDAASDEGAFNRQEQIWTGLYGPAQAKEMLAAARALRADQPEADIKAVFAAVEPGDDEDESDAIGIARPGVG